MADYIIEPLDTDADAIFQGFVDHVRLTFPDWEPSEAQLDVIIARYFSMQAAFTADMASRVQRAIYRYFGANLAGINPLPGAQALAMIEFTFSDPLDPPVDRVLPYGTEIGLTDANGDTIIFTTNDDINVNAGDLTGEVEAQAVELGVSGNDITGTVQMIELFDWVEGAVVVGASSGGADPESDDDYIQRLTANLALMAPRPILADDFAVYAKNIPGVWRATVIENFNAGSNELQVISSNYTAGNFKLTLASHQTANIVRNCTATQLRDALAALTNIDAIDLHVTGGPLPTTPITVEFINRFGNQDVPGMTFDITGLSGGDTFSIVETDGAAYTTDLANSIAISAVDVSGNPLTNTLRDELLAYLESTRPQNYLITYEPPVYHTVAVQYEARALRYQDPDSLRTIIDGRLLAYLDRANWGVYPGAAADNRSWVLQDRVRYLELTTVVENTPGVDYIESLTFSLDGGASNTDDKMMSGIFPMATAIASDIDGTVTLPS
jgi:hypothetical protein